MNTIYTVCAIFVAAGRCQCLYLAIDAPDTAAAKTKAEELVKELLPNHEVNVGPAWPSPWREDDGKTACP